MSEERKYIYPVDELDKIIEQMDKGITPMMSDQMQIEVQMRLKELQNMLFDCEDDDEIDTETRQKHREMLTKHIEESKRKASRDDVYVIGISDSQKETIRKEMSSSIVRPDPNDPYNKPDDELYNDQEKRIIYQRLASLRNAYYNQKDYANAISIIMDAINYSLEHDYPWLTKEEALKEFNAGHIKLKYCKIPNLYINNSTIITDPEILKGIVSGDIVLKDKRDEEKTFDKDKNKNYVPVSVDYNITSSASYEKMVAAHRQGYDTPMSTAIKHKSTVYNRYAIPINNRFSNQNVDKGGQPILFDWSKEGAGEEYFNLIKGRKVQTSDIVRILNEDNNNMLNNVVVHNMNDFLRSMKQNSQYTGGYDYTMPNNGISGSPMQYNAEAARVEQDLLASIRANNPSR